MFGRPVPPHDKARPKGVGHEEKSGDELDDKLKQLGEEFLDEDVPEALLELLRRGSLERSNRKDLDEQAENRPEEDKTSNEKPRGPQTRRG